MTVSLVGMVCSECGNGTYAVSRPSKEWIATCTQCKATWVLLPSGRIKVDKEVIGSKVEVVEP